MLVGTSYFTSKTAALSYYAYEGATDADIDRKLSEGLIHIGEPQLKPGQWLRLIDDGARYAIDDGPMSRADYMDDSRRRHDAYFLQVALEIGLKPAILPASVDEIREALKTDENLNNIPLAHWDARVSGLFGATAALKKRGDWLSLGTGVCILKAYAKYLAQQKEG